MLTIDKLCFSYQDKKNKDEQNKSNVNMEFNLEVKEGEILSVIGPSGSGKTTLLNLIAGFLTPTSGRVLVNQQDIIQLEISQRPVTTVFQENNLFPHLDVFTNVALGIQPSLKLKQNETQQINSALDSVGIGNLTKRFPKALSGGQRQRVALARALVRQNSVLLLDEPLAALGPAMREEIIDLLKELVQKEKMCALLISHQPDDALQASARTAFINEGKVIYIDDSDKILRNSNSPEVKKYLGEAK